MSHEMDYTIKLDTQAHIQMGIPKSLLEEHSTVLDKFDLEYKTSDYYYEISEPEWVQGWMLDISVIPIQFESLLETILPALIRNNIPFKVAKDAGIGRSIMDGDLGYSLLGKFVTIYLPNEARAREIAIQIIFLTKSFKGPEILTDRWLGSRVYTRYGACKGVHIINDKGFEEMYIYNPQGNLVKDPINIPFILPSGIKWPFADIASPDAPKTETTLQERYRPMIMLKEDAKGSVKKGLYLEKYWRIKWCIIKEGKYGMLGDSKGRDMTDRLHWQYELHKELENFLPLPVIYDLFEENGDLYLIMEFIKGKPFHYLLASILKGRAWQHLDSQSKMRILGYCSGVLDIIERMHAKGYIHRDITPANFLVNKRQQIWMIDLELSYCESARKPKWPFRLGTPGFMSPEQEVTLLPTVEQDIYAIGALFIFLFTGLMPSKFAQTDQGSLMQQLNFFISDKQLNHLLSTCLESDPKIRPSLARLKSKIQELQNNQERPTRKGRTELSSSIRPTDRNTFKNIIQDSLKGLVCPVFLNTNRLWVSQSAHEDDFSYSHNKSLSVYTGFFQGISGIVWLLARAHKLGFTIDPCRNEFENSLDYGRKEFSLKSSNVPAGLYFGTAGLVTAIVESISNSVISEKSGDLAEIKRYFKNVNTETCGIAKGQAGQGIALLRALMIWDDADIHLLLQQKVDFLLSQQERDGSWIAQPDRNHKAIKFTGFGYGVAGIVCFLMTYIQQYRDEPPVRKSLEKAMNWLVKRAYKRKGHTMWHLRVGTRLFSYGFQDGLVGVALAMVKAYEVLKYPVFKDLAEDCLRGFEPFPVSADITQANGLAGLGEVYLEAERVFKTGEWQGRASWIAEFILHHFRRQTNGSCYWMPNETPFTTAGFMEGNCGIIHFLLRYYEPGLLNHPFLV